MMDYLLIIWTTVVLFTVARSEYCTLPDINTTYRVTDHNCTCNVNSTGTLRYRQQNLQICNGQEYVDACRCETYSELGSKDNPAASCLEILSEDNDAKSGVYYLKNNNAVYKSYCLMETICGSTGWAMIIKIDGTKSTFHYASPYWMNEATYNENIGSSGGLDDQETKLQSYTNFPFTMLCLGVRVGNETNWIDIEYSGESLYSIIADNEYRKTNRGRLAWKSLVSGSSLQSYCNLEGFNVRVGYGAMARIGILGDNDKDCTSPDSRLGLGTSGNRCDQDDSNAAGNEARCGADNGDMSIKGFGYIFAQTHLVNATRGFAVNPARSCQEIKLTKPYSTNGPYFLNLTGNVSNVYCHMDTICGSSGWTMIMKIDGEKQTFAYDSDYWTSRNVFNVESVTQGLNSREEIKLSTYSEFSLSKICLGMKTYDGNVRWIALHQNNASTLYSIISTNGYQATKLGRDMWKSLISNSSLQMNCNREGFNVKIGEQGARIGILSNDEFNCDTSESRIGFGTIGTRCEQGNSTAGNEAGCDADNGDIRTPVMGYIFAQ